MHKDQKPLSYREAGVDIDAGEKLIQAIKPLAASTRQDGVLQGLGGFGGLFQLPTGYREPVLVSGTDGVGTKLKLAQQWRDHAGIGIDLVAMCANDIVVLGAKPLFFLDYYATGKLDVQMAKDVIGGIAEGCRQAGCALIGGETAEMPGFYEQADYDLAGFCVGIVEKSAIIDGCRVQVGDTIVGLASSGPHANGYSLIREVVKRQKCRPEELLEDRSMKDWLLRPTQIYVQPILDYVSRYTIHAMAHITGGGLLDNIPRVLPKGCQAYIHCASWPFPAIFDWLEKQGAIERPDMFRTFNCGIGMALILPNESVQACLSYFNKQGMPGWAIGEITAGDNTKVVVD